MQTSTCAPTDMGRRLKEWTFFAGLLLFHVARLGVECDSSSARSLVTLNPVTPLGFGIQITVPLSFFMPDLGFFGRHSRAHHQGRQFTSSTASAYSFRRKNHLWRRPGTSSTFLEGTCSDDGVPVDYYLQLLQIDVESCQQRFICEIASDPARFQPLSDLLLRKLARVQMANGHNWKKHLNSSSSSAKPRPFDGHYDLAVAARKGVESSGAACSTQYADCPSSAESMVNVSLLFVWRIISSTLNIRINGEVFD